MKYPKGKTTGFQKQVFYGNRGMVLEKIIDITNVFYKENNMALIYKKPTPINIKKVEYNNKQVKGYLKTKSSLDYVGVYNGTYLDFDAKSTKNKTAFPLSNIHDHQLEHIRSVNQHGGFSFILIEMNERYFCLSGKKLLYFINNQKRKSIPYNYLENECKEIKLKANLVLDYLSVIELMLKENDIYEK